MMTAMNFGLKFASPDIHWMCWSISCLHHCGLSLRSWKPKLAYRAMSRHFAQVLISIFWYISNICHYHFHVMYAMYCAVFTARDCGRLLRLHRAGHSKTIVAYRVKSQCWHGLGAATWKQIAMRIAISQQLSKQIQSCWNSTTKIIRYIVQNQGNATIS